MPGNVGFMAMPPMTAGGQLAAMSDAATAFGIPAKSTKKDAAAAFLNYLSSDEARQIAIDNGFMPTGTASTRKRRRSRTGSVLTEVQTAFQAVSEADGQVPFVQNATPGISNQGVEPGEPAAAGRAGDSGRVRQEHPEAKYERNCSR